MDSDSFAGRDVAVIVPVLNGARTLAACLRSLDAQTVRPDIVVVDGGSTDGSVGIAEQLADVVIVSEPGVSHQRNVGAAATRARIVGFVDADMTADTRLVQCAVEAIANGYGSLVVPERSFGRTYWARVRSYERQFYVGDASMEAARFFRRDIFDGVGGFNERLTAMEDWALSRAVERVATQGRTESWLHHDEGAPSLLDLAKKKASYATGIACHGREFGMRFTVTSLLSRPFVRRPWIVFRRPILGAGVIVLKSTEAAAVTTGVLLRRCSRVLD